MKKLIIALSIVFLLGGCASVPMASIEKDKQAKEFKLPPEGKSGIYVFRDTFLGGALKKTITIDGEVVGETAPDMYFYKIVNAGEHVISTESEFSPNDLVIKTQSKENYFVENYIKPGVFVGGANLRVVEPEEGKSRVIKLGLAEEQ